MYLQLIITTGLPEIRQRKGILPFFLFPILKTGATAVSGDRITSLSMDTMSKNRASLSTVKGTIFSAVVCVFYRSR
jgi:hypothetical protein